MAESTTITIKDIGEFKRKALLWANHFNTVCLLASNSYPYEKYGAKDWMLTADATCEIKCGENAFKELMKFNIESKANIFGFLSYDLKNQVEKLESNNHDGIKFPELYFFQPRYIFEIRGDRLTVNRNYLETYHLIEAINNSQMPVGSNQLLQRKISLTARTPRKRYLENVEQIRKQISEGEFYELNYCNEFYAEQAEINPVETFLRLNDIAQAPFSCFFKLGKKFLLSASPERFLKKEGNKLISQPIKGTIRRGNTVEENELLKRELKNNEKEKSENVMIVDMMRNDLSKSSKTGTVRVEELYGIYEFNTVNQMISTVVSEVADGIETVDIIKNAFPMGSMTGAPKVTVMQNIERYEDSKRGLFSGSVGYVSSDGDFDFNVVIRSILYNAEHKYLSIQTGGAITHNSVPEKEYEEILLKAEGLVEVLGAEIKC